MVDERLVNSKACHHVTDKGSLEIPEKGREPGKVFEFFQDAKVLVLVSEFIRSRGRAMVWSFLDGFEVTVERVSGSRVLTANLLITNYSLHVTVLSK